MRNSQRFFCLMLIIFANNLLHGQDLEPRRYAALPTKLNAAAVVYGLSHGNVVSDPALPISDFKITMHNLGLGYVRTFGLFNRLSRISIAIPYTFMSGQFTINGHDTSGTRNGFNDMQLRWGINLTGSPAENRQQFVKYRQETIFGFSMVVNVPTGTYHAERRINTGSNRWAVKPEVGLSKRFKNVYAEIYSGVWFYSNNKRYLGNKTLEQRPMIGVQSHVCYYFKNGMWVSVNGTWFNGGETIVDDVSAGDIFDNWRVGGTWSVPFSKAHSIKLQFHVGAFAARGYDYNIVSVAYQYVFF